MAFNVILVKNPLSKIIKAANARLKFPVYSAAILSPVFSRAPAHLVREVQNNKHDDGVDGDVRMKFEE